MSNYKAGDTNNLFDFDTGEFVGVVGLDGKEKLVGTSTTLGQAQSIGSVSGAITINLASGSNIALTITGNTTLTFTGLPATGNAMRAILTITNGGAGTITWPAGTRWLGAGIVGSAPTLQAAGVEKIAIDITNFAGTVAYDASYIGRVA